MTDILDRFGALLGVDHVLTGESVRPYAFDWRGREPSAPLAVLRPGSTEQVAAVIRLCAEADIPVVPQGGNTGLVGGTVVQPGTTGILLNLSRMNRIRDLSVADYSITVEAGCTLQDVQDACLASDRLFGLNLGAAGTCTIGGNLSSNAGGVLTIRYGNARDLVLGLEVVLPDGQIWNGLTSLRKNNTGYDLKHLFLGAEGTLGVITAATCKLFPRPRSRETALAALPSPAAAVELLGLIRGCAGEALSAFELMPRFAIDGARTYLGSGGRDPFAMPAPWYLLLELTTGLSGPVMREAVEAALGDAMARGIVLDAIFAESEDQRRVLWRLREGLPEIGRKIEGAVFHDISVPVAAIPEMIERTEAALQTRIPGCRPYPFGHVGDGNLHFNIAPPADMHGQKFLERAKEVTDIVHGTVLSLNGSISAEHGIGRRKKDELVRMKSALELDLMRRIKSVLDPQNIMNPGKLLPDKT